MRDGLLLDRVTYYVEALDPALAKNREPRTLDQVVHDYLTDDEPRKIARVGGWPDLSDEPAANAVASHITNFTGTASHLHRPLLDVDGWVSDETLEAIRATLGRWCPGEGTSPVMPHDVQVVPSSTLGHHHVYVATILPEVGYMHALMDLAAQRIIEPNYALVSIRRRATFLRLPGVEKVSRPVFHEEGVPW